MKNDDWKIRKNSLRLPNFDYASRSHFVTVVTQNRQKYFKNEKLARVIIKALMNLREKYKFNIYSYCLMPDHFHGLIRIGESELTLGRICGHFKSVSTRDFWNFYEGKLWQRQFFDHVIRNEQDFAETIKYIRLNPVKAGFVENWKDWKWAGEPDL